MYVIKQMPGHKHIFAHHQQKISEQKYLVNSRCTFPAMTLIS